MKQTLELTCIQQQYAKEFRHQRKVFTMMEFIAPFPPITQAFFATLFTWFVTALGAGFVLFTKNFNQKLMDWLLGFAGGVMIAASFWSLLLPSIELSKDMGLQPWLPPLIGFLIGGAFLRAIEVGIGKVIYNDIYDVSCKDVENLSKALSINLEHIVCGDTSSLISYVQENRILVDAIVSCDVIEHIYNPQEHFLILSQLQDKPFKLVYSSDANSKNFFAVKKLSDKQKRVEFQSRTNQYGFKKRDTLQPYWSVRRQIIKAYDPNLSSDELDDLATRTRGLVKEDIHFFVKELQETGKITYIPDHPTNTCDPYTGNWCEHLMDFGWLIKVSSVYSFELSIRPGYFQQTGKNPLKDSVKKILNNIIRLGGEKALAIAPRYTLHGHFSGSPKLNS